MTLIGCENPPAPVSRASMDNEPWQQRAKKAGLSQKTLAMLLGVHVNTVSQQLRGKWASGETPRYVKAVIWAWERLPQKERDAMIASAQQDYEDDS